MPGKETVTEYRVVGTRKRTGEEWAGEWKPLPLDGRKLKRLKQEIDVLTEGSNVQMEVRTVTYGPVEIMQWEARRAR